MGHCETYKWHRKPNEPQSTQMVVMTVGMAPSQLRPWVFPWLSEVLDVLAASSWLLVGDDGGPGGNTGLSAMVFEVPDVTSMSAETAHYPVE